MNLEEGLNKDFQFDAPLAPKQTRWKAFWLLFRQNRMAIVGLFIFILFFLSALIGLVLTSGTNPVFDPALVRLQEKLRPPLARPNLASLRPNEVPGLGLYLMGTDDLGRDVFARMLQGAWVSLTVGFVAVGIAVLIGIFLGGIAGYFGQHHIRTDHILLTCLLVAGAGLVAADRVLFGIALILSGLAVMLFSVPAANGHKHQSLPAWVLLFRKQAVSVDTLIMRIVDIMLCFPSFFLILTVVALLPASIYNIMIVIGLTSWMGTTRFVRAEFLSLRELDFVAAARALGVGNFRIIFRHMMPNAIAPVLVSATIGIASAILTEAGLSFLGFGVPPPHATWGNILADGKNFIFDAPWLTFIPGIAILVVVLSFNLFGEGLRDILNPKLRERQ
ncbi:MAG: ABC transporter permease [Pseudomonadota bacterium]|uniref:ABC transporter permease n=1 Tax=Candidatus Desulfatibia profunda TaxID=2841695 RepID=A0A8J6NPK0_9BACT|nr:ABC transporter permease [Candidatus Desulfatibia profunda]MBL7180554.1 ABC transporter permease [Desulfobacterales bacterium]